MTVTEECILGPPVVLVYAYEGDATQASSVACWIDGVADYVNLYEYDTQGNLVQIVQAGQSGGNAVAEKEIEFAYNEAGQLATMTRYLEGELVVVADYAYDSYGRRVQRPGNDTVYWRYCETWQVWCQAGEIRDGSRRKPREAWPQRNSGSSGGSVG